MKRIMTLFFLINVFYVFALPEMKFISGGKYNYHDSVIEQEDFYISKTKITVGQWKEFLADKNVNSATNLIPKMQQVVDDRELKIDDGFPVWGLTYLQIIDFCNWLSEKNKLKKCYSLRKENGAVIVDTDYNANGYRLPTLREWYYVSELWMNRDASYYESVNILKGESVFDRPYPYSVESEKNNSFGIKDPLGNIYELCNDYYLENENLKLLKSDKYGPKTYTPDPDQLYYKEPLTAVYIHVGGTHNDTYEKIKDKFIWEINLLSADLFSFRVVRSKS